MSIISQQRWGKKEGITTGLRALPGMWPLAIMGMCLSLVGLLLCPFLVFMPPTPFRPPGDQVTLMT